MTTTEIIKPVQKISLSSKSVKIKLAGIVGPPGKSGNNGLSAYDLAVKNGFTGTESQYLASMSDPKWSSSDW